MNPFKCCSFISSYFSQNLTVHKPSLKVNLDLCEVKPSLKVNLDLTEVKPSLKVNLSTNPEPSVNKRQNQVLMSLVAVFDHFQQM